MATLKDIKRGVHELPEQEALGLILDVRKKRATAAPPKVKKEKVLEPLPLFLELEADDEH